MRQREFALVRVRTDRGVDGLMYTLTRDGAVAEQIRKTIAAIYVGTTIDARERTFTVAWRRSLASHAAGIGLRALSIVDLACWDAAAKLRDQSIAGLLGGRNQAMPATAIIGYPPGTMGPAETGAQTAELYAAGWRRFKAPIGGSAERSAARLRAARAAAPDAWLGMDAAWVYEDVETAAASSTPSRTWAWAGSRMSSRPATRACCASCATASACPSRWATSRGARTSRRRSSSPGPWTWCGST